MTFFIDWFGLWRVVIVGTLAYVALVLLLRVSGKRTLSKMNAFDFIVTVALGSTLATVLLSKDVALAEGITAFALLIGLQYGITWLSVRSRRVENLVKAAPSLLFFGGNFSMNRCAASALPPPKCAPLCVHRVWRISKTPGPSFWKPTVA